MRNQKGYTLIEVLAVIIIILIFSGLLIPSFRGIFTNSKLKTSARTLANEIRYTQQLAIANKSKATIYFSKHDGKFSITQSSKTIKSGVLMEDVEYDVVTFEDKRCVFGVNGCPNGGSIYIKSNDKYYTITVLPVTGRVVIYDYKKDQ